MAYTAKRLQAKWGGMWGAHPVYRLYAWQQEVADNTTRLGYWEWVAAQIDPECGMCGEPYSSHRQAADNRPPFCMAVNSREGDSFIRGGK